jgi:hypothetical protein
VILKSVENGTKITLEKLKEEYQAIFKVQSSFSNLAIIMVFPIIFSIVTIDLCRLYSFLKLNKNKIIMMTENKPVNIKSKIEKKKFKPQLEIAKKESDKIGEKKNKTAKILWKY